MKGKNWREYEPPKPRRRRRRKGGLLRKLRFAVVLFLAFWSIIILASPIPLHWMQGMVGRMSAQRA